MANNFSSVIKSFSYFFQISYVFFNFLTFFSIFLRFFQFSYVFFNFHISFYQFSCSFELIPIIFLPERGRVKKSGDEAKPYVVIMINI